MADSGDLNPSFPNPPGSQIHLQSLQMVKEKYNHVYFSKAALFFSFFVFQGLGGFREVSRRYWEGFGGHVWDIFARLLQAIWADFLRVFGRFLKVNKASTSRRLLLES